MLRIGITGGIGSGKTTVCHIFEVLGIPVYYADEAAKVLMNQEGELKREIIKHFGESSYVDGKLNRTYISSIVFSNPEKLKLLNSLVHPRTISEAEEWMKRQNSPYALKEAALIFESGSQQSLDYVIGVSAPKEIRISRSMQRDKISKELAEKKISQQMNEEEKMKLCDFLIINDETISLIQQVLSVHEQLLSLSKSRANG
jgi:dephospho-CoA kinase